MNFLPNTRPGFLLVDTLQRKRVDGFLPEAVQAAVITSAFITEHDGIRHCLNIIAKEKNR